MPTTILGVRPGKPGYEEIVVSPRMETVTWAKGTAITPKGEVWLSWNKHTDGTAEITVHGPEDVPITVRKGG